ncbi:MAG: hypothetical protein AAF514_21990, partial [Verrucomicrobiota bacterium]
MTATLSRNQASWTYLVSLGCHLLLLGFVSLPPSGKNAGEEASGRETPGVTEVVLPLSQWIEAPEMPLPEEPPPPEKAKERKAYVRTTPDQETLRPPSETAFISDRHTRVASDAPAVPTDDPTRPAIDGMERPGREVDDREYRDGPLIEESPQPEQPVDRKEASGVVVETPPDPSTESNEETEASEPSEDSSTSQAPPLVAGIPEQLPPDPTALPELPPPGDPRSSIPPNPARVPIEELLNPPSNPFSEASAAVAEKRSAPPEPRGRSGEPFRNEAAPSTVA